MKCYCGFEWSDDVIIKAFETDDFGEFFRCTVDPDMFDQWNSCMGTVAPEYGNGWVNEMFEPLKARYIQVKKECKIKKTRAKHKYMITKFSNNRGLL